MQRRTPLKYFYMALHPRVVVLVVAIDKEGKPNVMPASWTSPVCEEPPHIVLAMWRENYTWELIKESREFTLNTPTADLVDIVWKAGTTSGREVDKSKLLNLTFSRSKSIKTPIIEECIAHLECKVVEEIDVGESTLFIAEVVEAYGNEEYMVRGRWDLRKVEVLEHLGGRVFTVSTRVVYPRKK